LMRHLRWAATRCEEDGAHEDDNAKFPARHGAVPLCEYSVQAGKTVE
jgi:hypothetical protein